MYKAHEVFTEYCEPRFPNTIVPAVAVHPVRVLLGLCVLLNVVCALSNPGRLTKDESGKEALTAAHGRFAYDGVLYKPTNSWCEQAGFVKPARAKFCHMNQQVIEKFDHHNTVINNAVGLNNMSLYLMFLKAHILLFSYTFAIGALTIYQLPTEMDLWNQRFWTQKGEVFLEGHLWAIYGYASREHRAFYFTTTCCFIFAFMTILSHLSHTVNHSNGVTSWESDKRAQLQGSSKTTASEKRELAKGSPYTPGHGGNPNPVKSPYQKPNVATAKVTSADTKKRR